MRVLYCLFQIWVFLFECVLFDVLFAVCFVVCCLCCCACVLFAPPQCLAFVFVVCGLFLLIVYLLCLHVWCSGCFAFRVFCFVCVG